ncbi:hypothetical protein KJ359_001892 [Pestalotiopsis sp. 9143b]|nr:hypothetical protein KJ359_001892 [Pestalotiopsis sp. 9143b]
MAVADGPVEYRPYWPPTRFMSSVVTTGVVLSSVSSAPAEEIGIDVGYENRCEPTMGPGQEPNLPGGERSRAMPNTGLQSGDCTTFPYLNGPGIDLNFTAFPQNTAPACGSSAFDFNMPYPPFYTGWYGTDIPPQFLTLDYPLYYDGSDEHTPEYDGSATLSSPHSDIPLPLGLDIGPYQHQPFHDPSVLMPIMAENSLHYPPVNEFEQFGDDSDQYSIIGIGGTYSSCASQSSLHSGIQDDSYQMVQPGALSTTGQYNTVLFRTGGLNFTTRQGWEGAAIRDMGPGDWADDVIHTIKLTLGYCKNPIVLQVRRFKPVKGVDVTSRFWLDPHGQQQETEIAPFALADIKKHRKVLESHVIENAYDAVKQYAEDPRLHPLVGLTYKAA